MRHEHCCLLVGMLTFAFASPVYSQLVNGNFENGLNGWAGNPLGGSLAGCVTVLEHQGTGNGHFAFFEEAAAAPRTGIGSAAQLVQDFTVPAAPGPFTFRYRFVHSGSLTSPAMLPDSLAVSLVRPSDGARLVGSAGDEPSFTPAFFYADSNDQVVYDSARVTWPMLTMFRTVQDSRRD